MPRDMQSTDAEKGRISDPVTVVLSGFHANRCHRYQLYGKGGNRKIPVSLPPMIDRPSVRRRSVTAMETNQKRLSLRSVHTDCKFHGFLVKNLLYRVFETRKGYVACFPG